MALPKKFTTATTIVTKGIKIVCDHAPEILTGIGLVGTALLTKVGFNIKEANETKENYKGWEIWKQGKIYYAKKGKNKLILKNGDFDKMKKMIDTYENGVTK